MSAAGRRALNRAIGTELERIEKILARALPGFPYKLTLVARYVGAEPQDADILLTIENLMDLRHVVAILEKHQAGDAESQPLAERVKLV